MHELEVSLKSGSADGSLCRNPSYLDGGRM